MRETDRRALRGLLLMAAVSCLLVFAAWLTRPVPVVKDSLQTELLSVHVYRDGGYVSWYPEDMVQRQTARAITDHMAQCRERNTLSRAEEALEEAPAVQIYFRTEDTYRLICLGSREAAGWEPGWSADQDRTGLAARILDPEDLGEYILNQLGGDLSPKGR